MRAPEVESNRNGHGRMDSTSISILWQDVFLIEASGYFDREFYARNNADVCAFGMDALEHFCIYGWSEGRDPSPFFSVKFYMQYYDDVAKERLNPLAHYIRYGKSEGRFANQHDRDVDLIVNSGFFNEEYYKSMNADLDWESINPLEHFYCIGWREARDPGPDFQVAFYISCYKDVEELDVNPLVHYLLVGMNESRVPSRAQAEKRIIAESGYFNRDYYLEDNKDVRDSDVDALDHFYKVGAYEFRNPSRDFDTKRYVSENTSVLDSGINPLLHYIMNKADDEDSKYQVAPQIEVNSNLIFQAGDGDMALRGAEYLASYASVGEQTGYENETNAFLPTLGTKIIAFYLPQFHPFPENDRFWGKGFTEWTNVTKAKPLYRGHYQPRLPGELGFYDTRIKDVLKRQIELAKQNGISGFCFHHYFFGGKKIMRVPYNHILKNKDLDIPFCLHWANEPWTARFDGWDNQGKLLLEQNHSAEDDVAFIHDIKDALRDDRYIRINGRPLLLVYRPGIFNDMRATVARWRDTCQELGIDDPFVVMAETDFDTIVDPNYYGLDASVEFPPHGYARYLPDISGSMALYDRTFAGNIWDYRALVDASLARKRPDYTLFRCVVPDWDCTARRKDSCLYAHASPAEYERWLKGILDRTSRDLPEGARFVFVNAWNEWAEGAHLEPDRRNGYAYLNATSRALRAHAHLPRTMDLPKAGKLLIVSHDTCLGGAQYVCLHLMRWLCRYTSWDVRHVAICGGPLLDDFKNICPTVVLDELGIDFDDSTSLLKAVDKFCEGKPDVILANSVASGVLLKTLAAWDIPIVTHIHELQKSIEFYASDYIDDVIKYSAHFLSVSRPVSLNLKSTYGVPEEKISLVYEFIQPSMEPPSQRCRDEARARLGIEPGTTLLLGCGVGLFWRKGADIFIDVARHLRAMGRSNLKLLWLGALDTDQRHETYGHWDDIVRAVQREDLTDLVEFVGTKTDVDDYFMAADIFLLPSREDPFPLVVLQAANNACPTLCFEGGGGMPDFVEMDAGAVLPLGDAKAMALAAVELIDNPVERRKRGLAARNKFIQRHTVDRAAYEILDVLRKISGLSPAVSVVVPNYNKIDYLRARLDSIFNQTFRDFELLLLDDASTDGSESIISEYVDHPAVKIFTNTDNVGVFAQWRKGMLLARSDIIWIAEADDVCEPEFLATLLPAFSAPEVRLAYSQSIALDGESCPLFDYRETSYLRDISPTRWDTSYICDAETEVREALAFRNTIPNISAALFRKFNFESWYDKAQEMRLTGDWLFYLHAIKGGLVAYTPQTLNFHRRHEDTCSHRTKNDKLRFYETAYCQGFACNSYPVDSEVHGKVLRLARELWEELCLPDDEYEQAVACCFFM